MSYLASSPSHLYRFFIMENKISSLSQNNLDILHLLCTSERLSGSAGMVQLTQCFSAGTAPTALQWENAGVPGAGRSGFPWWIGAPIFQVAGAALPHGSRGQNGVMVVGPLEPVLQTGWRLTWPALLRFPLVSRELTCWVGAHLPVQIHSFHKVTDMPTVQFSDLVSKEAAQCVGILFGFVVLLWMVSQGLFILFDLPILEKGSYQIPTLMALAIFKYDASIKHFYWTLLRGMERG